jgi:hypothetical protein
MTADTSLITWSIHRARMAVLRLRLAYYQRALADMTLAHPDAGHVLRHISVLRDQLGPRA